MLTDKDVTRYLTNIEKTSIKKAVLIRLSLYEKIEHYEARENVAHLVDEDQFNEYIEFFLAKKLLKIGDGDELFYVLNKERIHNILETIS